MEGGRIQGLRVSRPSPRDSSRTRSLIVNTTWPPSPSGRSPAARSRSPATRSGRRDRRRSRSGRTAAFSPTSTRTRRRRWSSTTTTSPARSSICPGTTIHATYEFADAERIVPSVHVGELAVREVEVVRPGDVRRIDPGRRFIHQVWHVDQPTVVLVIRTGPLPATAPAVSISPRRLRHGGLSRRRHVARCAGAFPLHAEDGRVPAHFVRRRESTI